MDQQHCVTCGKKLSFFNTGCVRYGWTNQLVCTDCENKFRKADDGERMELLVRMGESPYLNEPEKFRAWLERERGVQEYRDKTYTCCGQPMSYQGEREFQLGSTDFLTGSLGNLVSGSLELSVFVCERCGQYKFYDPTRVPGTRAYQLAAGARENSDGEESAPPEPQQPEERDEKEPGGFFGRRKKDKPDWEL